jgi:DNA polymerase-3 subunit delta'
MKKIYGNDQLLKTMNSMILNDRAAHSLLLYGEKGCGKKLIARYYTELLLCEHPTDDGPCGVCTSCRNVEKDIHPDVIYPEKTGKLGGYSVDTARQIISDAFIKPNNNSGRKIYIFRDCHNLDIRTQNTLLKIVEEPPDYAYFIFTAEAKTEFLPTIISRCVCLAAYIASQEDSENALADEGFKPEEIQKAVECFHGNIGLCRDFILDESLRKQVDLTKSLADSIIRKDEYSLNAAFSSAGKERFEVKTVLMLLDKLVRDAAVLGENKEAKLIGCSRQSAERLAGLITAWQAVRIHRYIERSWAAIEANAGIPLALTALSAEISSVIS